MTDHVSVANKDTLGVDLQYLDQLFNWGVFL